MIAIVRQTNETCNPFRRYVTGEFVEGDEADRLVSLGLAEYNDEEPLDPSPEESFEESLVDDEEKES